MNSMFQVGFEYIERELLWHGFAVSLIYFVLTAYCGTVLVLLVNMTF